MSSYQNSLPIQPVPDWQSQLREAVTCSETLLSLLNLSAQDTGYAGEACRDFTLKVPMAFVRRMKSGDPQDPLLLQVLARSEELTKVPGYSADPVQEAAQANPQKGIIHKYRGRVLLITTGGCAINCRYCFRRHFPYAENQNSRAEWRSALAYISADQSIREVILSGGDPLVATDARLAELVTLIAEIPHVRRLRIHSRLPIVLPDRVTGALLDAITHPSLQTIMVVHCNHANEVDEAVSAAAAMISQRSITLLNQSVLLAGINNTSRALIDLSEGLFAAGIMPYYLHLLDKMQGAAHFDVPEQQAMRLMKDIAAELPGYLLPRLVREEAGASSKTLIATAP